MIEKFTLLKDYGTPLQSHNTVEYIIYPPTFTTGDKNTSLDIPANPIEEIKKPTSEGWQLCPKCLGDGHLFRFNSPWIYSDNCVCDVCNGEKILNIKTGLPPSKS